MRTIWNYTFFESPWPSEYKYAICKIFKTKITSRKTKIVQIPFEGVCAKIDAKLLCGNSAGKTICFIATSNTWCFNVVFLFTSFNGLTARRTPLKVNVIKVKIIPSYIMWYHYFYNFYVWSFLFLKP